MKGSITKRSVDALKPPPPGKREILWDKSLVGFGCMALPSGQKAYIVQYKRAGQRGG